MAMSLRRKGPTEFQRASDGSMTLVEHIRELRNRLFKASLALVGGFIVGYILAQPVFDVLKQPYCAQFPGKPCAEVEFLQLGAGDGFLLKLKLALWVGLIVASPVWLYQLWAFIAPGLHRHERKYAYFFVALAAPLFIAGAVLAYFVVSKGLHFLLEAGVTGTEQQLEVTRYISFVTNMLLIFGVAFEFPLIVLMLNFVGLASAKRLLGWWRVAVFVFFLFSAVVTPTPDPFGMTALGACLSALYFAAVGVAFLNDKRRGRGRELYADVDDDEMSVLEDDREPIPAGAPIEQIAPVAAPQPIDRRYDDDIT
ncbi:sec-independent protein translocase protein TatC [Asanoa hainanensis]|uniref:Sec-independent protein translocase protein TatC n=1 Tax=Asanoa hainanensis TaxID=560556 RepID=A0A239P9U1_9ACTN|nr:twin-arginine translocase subunit TatC [Asanoa hainanensis]SNT63745.1 sec-independent protein translocase protein TatC [Asanoa hainanensis]